MPRILPIAGAVFLAIVGTTTYLAVSPRLTLLNASIVLAYPTIAGIIVVLSALSVGALILLRTPVAVRLAMGTAAALLLLGGIQRLTYRIEADPDGLRLRTGTVRAALAWRQILRAETTGEELFLLAEDGTRLSVSLGELTPQQRVAVTRSISRRVSEAAGVAPPQ